MTEVQQNASSEALSACFFTDAKGYQEEWAKPLKEEIERTTIAKL